MLRTVFSHHTYCNSGSSSPVLSAVALSHQSIWVLRTSIWHISSLQNPSRDFFFFLILLIHFTETKSPTTAMSLWAQQEEVTPGALLSAAPWGLKDSQGGAYPPFQGADGFGSSLQWFNWALNSWILAGMTIKHCIPKYDIPPDMHTITMPLTTTNILGVLSAAVGIGNICL